MAIEKNQLVMIESLTKGSVSIRIPDLNLKRVWEKKGAKKPIEFGVLQQAIYDPGVEYMFTQGILGIDDLDIKIALGLEPEGATKSVNIIILTDKEREKLWRESSKDEFLAQLKKLSNEQMQQLADYAISNEIMNMDKSNMLKKAIGTDIISAIKLNRANKED